MLINKKIIFSFIFFLVIIFLFPKIGFTQDDFGVSDVDTALGGGDIKQVISNIIDIFLGFLGILSTIIILYGGFLWMTAKGVVEQIDKAKKIIINGIIGLIIIMSAYAIASFVLRSLIGEGDDISSSGSYSPGSGYTGGGLGAGVLESHYPVRNATGIVKNTNIFVTFKEPINIQDFIIQDCNHIGGEYVDCVSNDYIKLIHNDIQLDEGDLMIKYSEDKKVFEFNPYGDSDTHLESDGNTEYQMVLDSLETVDGVDVFFSGVYDWSFTVTNDIDLIPPEVSFVIPDDGSLNNPRNSIVQINFSESVNPITAAGINDGAGENFLSINLNNGGSLIYGVYIISNQYKTVEFSTFDGCGENSCGGMVYCLPDDSIVDGIVTTDITDMAGNSLLEEYNWQFQTSDEVDLTPPIVIDKTDSSEFNLENPILAVFSKSLLTSSVNSDNIILYKDSPGDWGYWLNVDTCDGSVNSCNVDNCGPDFGVPCNNTIIINHDTFWPTTEYILECSSRIKDLRQNCWFPCALN